MAAQVLQLDNRAVIRLSGNDSRTFLQGLVTNDVAKVAEGMAVYTALLTPQGKFLFDMIITAEGDDLLLDVEAERKPDLMRRLMMYKLRSNVEIHDDSRFVWALFNGEAEKGIAYTDPRHKSLHQRVICEENPLPTAESLPLATYEERRIRHGVPDGSRDMLVDKYFWLETGAERLNGVSFTKGCFIGQELTARMKHRTTAKKMLMPVYVEGGAPEAGTTVETEDGKSAGDLHTSQGNHAIAYMRLEYAEAPLFVDGKPLTIRFPKQK